MTTGRAFVLAVIAAWAVVGAAVYGLVKTVSLLAQAIGR